MKKLIIGVILIAAALTALAFYSGTFDGQPGAQATGGPPGGRGGGRGGNFGGGSRAPLTVEIGRVTRASIDEHITVVGNLVGDATVSVAPRTAGRLEEISVRLGDRVTRGQRIAKIEDYELLEQVKQADAAQEVSLATIRQREADLRLAETNAERSRNLYERQLLPKQTLDDTDARWQAAVAQLDLARAQHAQSRARLDELRITLSNTVITSPVNGFVSRREVDPGAFVSQNAPVVDVVDITSVRLVANVVERDLSRIRSGNPAEVQVDAFPGETFTGRIARVSPVLDPATRTAPIEIEIPNREYRLKPGMYARVGIVTGVKKDALVVPTNALVDLGGRRGVFVPRNDTAVFRIVQVGLEQPEVVEILAGLTENEPVITTGSAALRDGDRIVLSGETGANETRAGAPDTTAAHDTERPVGPAAGQPSRTGPRR